MMTVTFMIGGVAMCEGIETFEFITDDAGLRWIDGVIEDFYWEEFEYIVLVDGVPYKWNLYIICGG